MAARLGAGLLYVQSRGTKVNRTGEKFWRVSWWDGGIGWVSVGRISNVSV